MSDRKVNAVTLGAWLFTALTAPLAQIGAGMSWVFVLAVGAVCGILCWCIHFLSDGGCCRAKWYCLLELLWLAVAAGVVTHWTAACWPTGEAYPVVPLVLLALAGASAWEGAARASRAGGTVFWFVALLYAILLAAGVKELRPQWMAPRWAMGEATLIFAFLIPAVAAFLPREKGKGHFAVLLCILAFAGVVTFLVMGTMSPGVAEAMEFPFYEYSKSLSFLGVAERFESFASVALTMGYFALLSLFLSGAGHLAETVKAGCGRAGILICAGVAALSLLCLPEALMNWLPLLALLFWGVLPFGAYSASRIKKSKKEKKTS